MFRRSISVKISVISGKKLEYCPRITRIDADLPTADWISLCDLCAFARDMFLKLCAKAEASERWMLLKS